ncbi:NAD-dependent epimerase/dehydratase family protein [Micromonospora coxensis]|uniref:Nucleoside-diphosphate-sugar epimerase n=1 Tax=Micromonospora coxensis TaxID=356852 RepID=A0A1C5JRC7_9ACTN|nr:NAD(P)-dependent oxidoreductase [Micromonospora coxensis]SCG72871.1 Nucleoside-diphosphate-sugar epimerase [Micromonospora coxensis]
MNVLLFGASGFLGRHIRQRLAEEMTVHSPTRQECDLVTVDVRALTALLTKTRPDAVVVAAGRIVGSGHEFVLAHTVVVAKLVEAMALSTPGARLVRIGSAAEYGVVPHGHAVREDDAADPVGEYGISHLAATRLVERAVTAGQLDAVVLRVFNPVGPGMPAGNLLGRTATRLREAMAHGVARLPLGLHDTWRDYVDVRDIAAAVSAALRPASPGAVVFNVGSGRAVGTPEVVRLLADAAGFRGEITEGDFAPDAARSAAVSWMCADLTRTADLLGWSPRHALADSLATVWADVDGCPRTRPVTV